MNLQEMTTDNLRAFIEAWLSAHMQADSIDRDDIMAKLTPTICAILKGYGFKILSDQDFAFIQKALDDIKMDKNMKKVLLDYNKSIIEMMEDK